MNLLDIATSIWNVKGRALLIALLAGVVAVVIAFRVSLSPFGVHPNALQLGAARADILVDSVQSPLADASVSTAGLSSIADTLSEIVTSPAVTGPIARSVGTRSSNIGVDEQLSVKQPLAVTDTREPEVGVQVLNSRQRYHVLVKADQGSMTIQIYTQAPTGREAVAMANAAADAMQAFTRHHRHSGVPARRRVMIDRLGAAVGGVVDRNASLEAAILIGVTIWLVGIVCLLTVQRLLRDRRRLGAHGTSSDGRRDAGADALA